MNDLEIISIQILFAIIIFLIALLISFSFIAFYYLTIQIKKIMNTNEALVAITERFNQALTTIGTSLVGIQEDVSSLKAALGDQVSPEVLAILDGMATKAETLAAAAQTLDESTTTAPATNQLVPAPDQPVSEAEAAGSDAGTNS